MSSVNFLFSFMRFFLITKSQAKIPITNIHSNRTRYKGRNEQKETKKPSRSRNLLLHGFSTLNITDNKSIERLDIGLLLKTYKYRVYQKSSFLLYLISLGSV